MHCQSRLLLRQLHNFCRLRIYQSASLQGEGSTALKASVGLCHRQQRGLDRSKSTFNRSVTASSQASASTVSRPASAETSNLRPVEHTTEAQLREIEQHLGPFSTSPSLKPSPSVVVIISGPSGVGKDAVINQLKSRRSDLHFVVTATSRAKRPGEVDGVDYHFVSKEQFEEWIASNALLEHAVVYGEYKGIPRQQVLEALERRLDVVLRIDVQGAATIRAMIPDAVSIFLMAESEAELVHRLVDRKTETMDKLLKRITTARTEAARLSEFDYVVVNQDGKLDHTVRQIEAILEAEKSRVSRRLAS